MSPEDAQYLISESTKRGYDPLQLATVLQYESGMRPAVWGGKDNNYYGILQFGPEERKQFGIDTSNPSFKNQLDGAFKFFEARGYKPSMPFADMYSTVSAGSPGHYSASDGNNTVSGHVASMMRSSLPAAQKILSQAGYQVDADKLAQFKNDPEFKGPLGQWHGEQQQAPLPNSLAGPVKPPQDKGSPFAPMTQAVKGLLAQDANKNVLQADEGLWSRARALTQQAQANAMRGLL